jgi:hypothetical protein
MYGNGAKTYFYVTITPAAHLRIPKDPAMLAQRERGWTGAVLGRTVA